MEGPLEAAQATRLLDSQSADALSALARLTDNGEDHSAIAIEKFTSLMPECPSG